MPATRGCDIDRGGIAPNLFIVGVPKAGTTTLARWLVDHPCVAGGVEKELRFLMDPDDPLGRPDGYRVAGLAGYARLFPPDAAAAQFRLDASPQYYYQRTALEVIRGLPGAHVVFVFRNPARRIYSLFKFAQNNQAVVPAAMTFRQFLDELRRGDTQLMRERPMLRNSIRHGEYAEYVRRWQEAVAADHLHFVLFEDLVREPRTALTALCRRIGLEPGVYERYPFPVENETYRVRSQLAHRAVRGLKGLIPARALRRLAKPLYYALNTAAPPEVSPGDREALRELEVRFASSNAALEELTGLDLTSWAPRQASAV